jgi:VanZ family protein
MRYVRGTPERPETRWICSRQASLVFLAVVLLAVLGLSLNPRPETLLGRLGVYDKAGHFAAYVALGFFAARAFGRPSALTFLLTLASCSALGGLIEIVQPLVGRQRELADFLVDLGGTAVGAAIAIAVERVRKARAGRAG